MDTKLCKLCDRIRPAADFSWKSISKKQIQSYCKQCQNQRSKAHYNLYRQAYIKKARLRNRTILKQIQEYVWSYLSTHRCVDCGEADIVVLEFDHIEKKEHNLSEIIRERSSLRVVEKEISKCVVRCANCHRRKTAKDFSWKKLITRL